MYWQRGDATTSLNVLDVGDVEGIVNVEGELH